MCARRCSSPPLCISPRASQENESSCQSQLNKFPLVVQTPLLQRRVDELNNKLKEIDAAKAIFSRARVRAGSKEGQNRNNTFVACCILGGGVKGGDRSQRMEAGTCRLGMSVTATACSCFFLLRFILLPFRSGHTPHGQLSFRLGARERGHVPHGFLMRIPSTLKRCFRCVTVRSSLPPPLSSLPGLHRARFLDTCGRKQDSWRASWRVVNGGTAHLSDGCDNNAGMSNQPPIVRGGSCTRADPTAATCGKLLKPLCSIRSCAHKVMHSVVRVTTFVWADLYNHEGAEADGLKSGTNCCTPRSGLCVKVRYATPAKSDLSGRFRAMQSVSWQPLIHRAP